MARFKEDKRKPSSKIMMLQQTVENLSNNDITIDYFNMLKKIINQGYILYFQGYGGEEDLTEIKDVSHLKNYINTLQDFSII